MPTRKALAKSNQYMRKTVKAQSRRSIRTSSKKVNPSKKALAKSAQYMRKAIVLRQPQNRGYKVKRFANDQGVFGVRVILDEDTDIQNLLNMINNLSHDFSQESGRRRFSEDRTTLPQTPPGYAETVNSPEFVAQPASPGNDYSRYHIPYARPPPGAAASSDEFKESSRHFPMKEEPKELFGMDVEDQTNDGISTKTDSCTFTFPKNLVIGGRTYTFGVQVNALSFHLFDAEGAKKFATFAPLSGDNDAGFCSSPINALARLLNIRRNHKEEIETLETSDFLLKLELYAAISLQASLGNETRKVMFWVQIFDGINEVFLDNDPNKENVFAQFRKDLAQKHVGLLLKSNYNYDYVIDKHKLLRIFDVDAIDFDSLKKR